MKKYTIGIVFDPEFTKVLLIEKNRPEWQKGKLNFPGGHIEDGETSEQCIRREFIEELGLDMPIKDWSKIGRIVNYKNYYVDIFTAVTDADFVPKNETDEKADWYNCILTLPVNVISNLRWLVPYAENFHLQGNADHLKYGTFEYQY